MIRSRIHDKGLCMMRAVQRVLGVFESFSPEQTTLSLKDIADRIDLPKSTAFRIVQSIEQAGYLVRLDDQRYCLSFRFMRLAGLVRSTLDIREISRPVLTELAEKTKESISLHTLIGRNRVCIDSLSAPSTLRIVVQPGEQIPLLSGSASNVLMAYMSKEQLSPILAGIARKLKRPQAEIVAELEKVRKQGYAVSHGERLLGLSAISAPIKDVNEAVLYCLSVAGPSVRIQQKQREFVPLVVKAAMTISRLYGARVLA
jgi:DNA-binding IclR family transcriptional regulator